MRHFSFILFFLQSIAIVGTTAQEQGVRPLRVGDTVPDLVFKTVINHSDSTAKLSDFEGKAMILDFWGIFCTVSISDLPKLQVFQEQYREDLKIVLLSSYSEEGIRQFYRKAQHLNLPTAYFDKKTDILGQLFPYREVPHYVWIDKNRKIVAITNGTEINDKNISDFLQGRAMEVMMKDDEIKWGDHSGAVLDSVGKLGRANMISVNPNIIFQSMVMKHDPRLTHVMHIGQRERSNKFFTFQNASLVHMMQYALGYSSSRDNWRFYLDLSDSTRTYPSARASADYQRTWYEKHSYTYRIILDRPDSARLHDIMRRDLEATFGIRSYTKRIKVPYLVLRLIGDKDKLVSKTDGKGHSDYSIYNITLRNRPLDVLINALYGLRIGSEHKLDKQQRLAVFDQTGIMEKIDIDIDAHDLQSMRALQDRLREYGLELSVETGELDMTVITDK